jgi:hypothetical protein
MVASFVSYGGFSKAVGTKRLVTVSLLCVIVRRELLSKICGLSHIAMVLYSFLASLLKWVIPIYLTSRICEYPTYRLILPVFVASIPAPYFNPMDVYVNYDKGLTHFVPCPGKTLSC